GRLESRPGRREPLDVSVVDHEPGGVPEREQLAPDITATAVAGPGLPRGGVRAVLRAHDIRAHLLKRVFGLDHVAPRAVHLAAVLVEHLLVAEGALKKSLAEEHDRHEELRVEPEPDLLAHLADPIGREPLLPVGVVW